MTQESIETIKERCYNKVLQTVRECLDGIEEAKYKGVLDVFKQQTLNVEFVKAAIAYEPTSENAETAAIRKALHQKFSSWFAREMRKAKPDYKEQPEIEQKYIAKTQSSKNKLAKKVVPITNLMTNTNWDNGITYTCVWMCQFGLANFSTFSAYFLFFDGLDAQVTYTAKLVKDDEHGGKKIIFVKN